MYGSPVSVQSHALTLFICNTHCLRLVAVMVSCLLRTCILVWLCAWALLLESFVLSGLQKRARIAVLEEEVKANKAALERVESQLTSMKADRTGQNLEGDTGREALLEKLAADEQAVAALTAQVAEQAASDPERLRELATATTTAREAANRWTDNVDTLRRYVSDKFGMDGADFARQFGVPADMEYLEETAPDAAHVEAPG